MSGKGKMLLMDDEQIILDVTREVLNFLNYDVMFAKEGRLQLTSTNKKKPPGRLLISSSLICR